MKKFLIGFVTILLAIAFLVLGISFTIKKAMAENIEEFVKESLITEVVNEVAKTTSVDKEKVKKELIKAVEKNNILKTAIEENLDKTLDFLEGKEIENIDISKELETILNNGEVVLKEYGFTLTKEEKEKLLHEIHSEKMNQEVEIVLKEVQESLPNTIKNEIGIFNFICGSSFKVICFVFIALSLLCIAFLKKSSYRWISNLSVSTLFGGLFYSLLLPIFLNFINQNLINRENISISFNALSTYGNVLVIIGILTFVVNKIFTKISRERIISN